MFSVAVTTNAFANLGVLAVVTWQVLFVSVPVVYLALRLQVSSHHDNMFHDFVCVLCY